MTDYIYTNDPSSAEMSRFDGSQVVVSDRFVMFWKPPCPFGQWTRSAFVLDGVTYNCTEQYMMAEKARLFEDFVIKEQILQCDNPGQQKKLGKRVANFVESIWIESRCDIVFRGNVAKFSQSEKLRQALLATGHRVLVEASPLDRIWGIGFAADHPKAWEPNKWRGLNLLGNVLTEVREHLRSES